MHSWHYEWGSRSTLTMVSGFTKSQREFRWRIWQERQAFETMEGTSTSCSLFLPSFFLNQTYYVYIYMYGLSPFYIYKIYRPSAEHGVLPSARLQEMDMLWSGSLQVPFLRIWCWNYVVFYHSKSAVLFGGSHVFSQVKLLKTCT